MIDPLLYILWSFNVLYALILIADAGWLEWMPRVRALRWAFVFMAALTGFFERLFDASNRFVDVTLRAIVNRTYDLIYWRRS